MKKSLFVVALLSALLCSGIANAEARDPQKTLFLTMLLGDDPGIAMYGARSIGHYYGKEPALTDYLAEHLIRHAGPEVNPRLVDGIKWCAIVLGDSGNPRYFDVLTLARQKYVRPDIHVRIDTALMNLGAKQGEQYVLGSVDPVAKRRELEESGGSQNRALLTGFVGINPGQSFTKALEHLGLPDVLSTMTFRVAKHGRGSKLVAHYVGAGALILTLTREQANLWTVLDIADEAVPVKALYKGDDFGLAQLAGSLRGSAFRDLLKYKASAIRNDSGMIAVLAKRLEVLSFPADEFEDDANAIAIDMIAVHATKDPGLLASLRTIAATNGGKKAKRYATNYVVRIESNQPLGNAAVRESESEDGESSSDEDKQ